MFSGGLKNSWKNGCGELGPRLTWPQGRESQQATFSIHFLGKAAACFIRVCVGQAQSSLGYFKWAPPPLAASEAIRRPGLGQMNGKVKGGPQSLRPLRRGLGVWRRAGGSTGRRALGAEAPPFIPLLYRPGRDESRLAGSAVHLL